MVAILSLIVVMAISFLVTRIATIALMHTGLSQEVARFQARSALTGAGFTTTESERLVNHPVRRRILMLLMLIGNAGIITAASSLILAFVNQDSSDHLWLKIALLITAMTILWALATSRWVDQYLSRLINLALKRYTSLEVRDFASLLGLSSDYRIVEILVSQNDWLAGKTLLTSRLSEEGILVLGIQRKNGNFLGTPSKETCVEPEDTLITYGHLEALKSLDERRYGNQGNVEHIKAVAQQKQRKKEEEKQDKVAQKNNSDTPE